MSAVRAGDGIRAGDGMRAGSTPGRAVSADRHPGDRPERPDAATLPEPVAGRTGAQRGRRTASGPRRAGPPPWGRTARRPPRRRPDARASLRTAPPVPPAAQRLPPTCVLLPARTPPGADRPGASARPYRSRPGRLRAGSPSLARPPLAALSRPAARRSPPGPGPRPPAARRRFLVEMSGYGRCRAAPEHCTCRLDSQVSQSLRHSPCSRRCDDRRGRRSKCHVHVKARVLPWKG